MEVTPADLWKECRSRDSGFLLSFRVFVHFCDKGWVPRSGMQFGADFVLYRSGGPTSMHAEAVVKIIDGLSGCPIDDWGPILRAGRVANSVKKYLVCAFVKRKATAVAALTVSEETSADDAWNDPWTCLEQLDVTTITLRRWVPDGEREAEVTEQYIGPGVTSLPFT